MTSPQSSIWYALLT